MSSLDRVRTGSRMELINVLFYYICSNEESLKWHAVEALGKRTAELADHIGKVNAAKLKTVQRIVGKIESRVRPTDRNAEEYYCILLGGDVVYGMAHDAPRTEHSTGLMVRGSDLDLVVNTAEIDFVHNSDDLEDLLEQIRKPHLGTRYYVPMKK